MTIRITGREQLVNLSSLMNINKFFVLKYPKFDHNFLIKSWFAACFSGGYDETNRNTLCQGGSQTERRACD